MGGGLGHVVAMARLVRQMVLDGDKVTCVLNDLVHAPRLLAPLGVEWLPAPRLAATTLITPFNHADILFNAGYDSFEKVGSLLSSWRTLFNLLRPDRVVCDYAPTALLAARSLHMETASIDSGFSMPPVPSELSAPLPQVRLSPTCEVSQLLASEKYVLTMTNRALEKFNAAPLGCFGEVFKNKVWYRNWPALNHFGPHSPDVHLGQIDGEGGRVEPRWPDGCGRKLFAYLKPGHKASFAVLKAALENGYRVLAYLPGFGQTELNQLNDSGNFAASSEPFDLSKLPDDVEIGIWHSPTGSVARCVDKGIRMIFLPMNSEQRLACRSAQRSGLSAHWMSENDNCADFLEKVGSLAKENLRVRLQFADVQKFAFNLSRG